MGLTTTLIGIAVVAALFALSFVMTGRPVEPGRPRLVPWLGIQLVSVVIVVVLLAHLVSLLTGTPLLSRRGY